MMIITGTELLNVTTHGPALDTIPLCPMLISHFIVGDEVGGYLRFFTEQLYLIYIIYYYTTFAIVSLRS